MVVRGQQRLTALLLDSPARLVTHSLIHSFIHSLTHPLSKHLLSRMYQAHRRESMKITLQMNEF